MFGVCPLACAAVGSRLHSKDLAGSPSRSPRCSLCGSAALLGVLVLLSGCGSSGPPARSSATGAGTTAAARARTSPPAGRRGGAETHTRGAHVVPVASESPDPEESKSFPVAGSVHHKAAATPSKAAQAVVAPGAPSDAEVRQELQQMHKVERSSRSQQLSIVPGGGSIGGNGTITPPEGIPEVVDRVIAGANAITDFPYVFGGGHASFVDNAYDCSGSVSYALAAGGLLSAPETSGTLESWGAPGPGKWITVYANAGHTYMYVNLGGGWVRYDTSGRSGAYASRWQPAIRSNAGFVARHWPGL
jgi:hypothetical protein